MFLFDFKYFLAVSIFKNILLSEGLKNVKRGVFTSYRSFYIKNYRKNNDFNYNFDDWETSTPDILYNLNQSINITENENKKHTLPKEETTSPSSNIIDSLQTETNVANVTLFPKETGEKTAKEEGITTPPIQEISTTIYLTTNSVLTQNSSSPDVYKTESLHFTLPSKETIKDLLEWLASTSPTEYTTVIPPPPTLNVEDLMPWSTNDILDNTLPSFVITTNPFFEDIKEDITKKHGFFSSSLHILLKVLSKKKSADFLNLITALNSHMERLIAKDSLVMFAGVTIEVFQSVIQMLSLAPADVREEYIKYAIYAVENRHTVMREDINSIFDVVDSIYTDNDVKNIGAVLKRMNDFPNISTDVGNLISDTVNVFVFEPHHRIVGTAKERLLLMEINDVLQNRLYPGEKLGRRFENRKDKHKYTTHWKYRYRDTDYHRHQRKQSKYTTIGVNHSKHISMIKNTKSINKQDDKNKNIRKNAKHTYNGNKITSIVEIFNDNRNEYSLESKSDTSSESSYSNKESSGQSLRSEYNYKDKILINEYNHEESDKKYFKPYDKAINKKKPKSKLKIRNENAKPKSVFTSVSKFYKFISLQDDEGNVLNQNPIDALRRSRKTVDSREFKKKINKIRDIESFSDEEAILKSNIYKVFGLTNDYRKQLGTLHFLRTTSG